MIWVGRLISFAAILQTIELFWVPAWSWDCLRLEIPRVLHPLLKSNRLLLTVRLLAAIGALLFGEPVFIAILLFSTWAIAIRWRGTFNGGSDAMTFLILAAWLLAACVPQLESVCLLYVAIQLVLSYFVAGIAKIFNPQWRNGEALTYFFAQSGFNISRGTSLGLSWILIAIECLFPFAFYAPTLFVITAITFHVANVYIFGLNRFFFAWLAAYPALFLILY
jgi:hypothetical protein